MKKHLIPVFAVASVALTAQASIPSSPIIADDFVRKTAEQGIRLEEADAQFNAGDLAGPDELSAEEDDGLDFEERETFYRATTPNALALHEKKRVQIIVNKSMMERGYQFVQVFVDGALAYDAPISTAWERTAKAKTRSYYAFTPIGKFFPDGMQSKRFSNTWQVWLKYVIRFSGGIWIHATTPDHYAELGAPASGGCVRVHESDAKEIYGIVSTYGMNETAITVLPQTKLEQQIPWTKSKLPMPQPLLDWRTGKSIL